MSVDDQPKHEFCSILSRINRKFDIIHTKWLDDRNFEAKFRTQIPRENDDYNALCDEWVDLFSIVTSTTWVKKISNTGPQIKFRKQYQCWTHPGEVRKELLFDPRKCKATVDVKVLNDNTHTRRKNKYIKQGLNVVVKLNFTHLHSAERMNPFAFFVHNCEPQPDRTKITTQPCGNIAINNNNDDSQKNHSPRDPNYDQEKQIKTECYSFDDSSKHMSMKHTNQSFPLFNAQNLDALKLPSQSQIQSLVQPQYEEVLMCQPLMYDAAQMIPVSASPFLQIHAFHMQHENEEGRY